MINSKAAHRPSKVGDRSATSKSIASVVSHHKHSPAESCEEVRVDPRPQPACRKTARTRSRWWGSKLAMRPPTSSSGLPTARASTSAKMWRSPEDTAFEYRYDLGVEPGDSSVVGPQPWLTRIHESPAAGPDQQLHRSLGRMASSCPVTQFRSNSAAIGCRCGWLIVVDLLGSDDEPESRVSWPLGHHAERRLLPRAAQVRWA